MPFIRSQASGFRIAHQITKAAPRHNILRTARIILDLLTQPANRYVHRTHVAKIFKAPYGLQQMLARHHFAAIARQIMNELELPMRQIERLVVLIDDVHIGIDKQIE